MPVVPYTKSPNQRVQEGFEDLQGRDSSEVIFDRDNVFRLNSKTGWRRDMIASTPMDTHLAMAAAMMHAEGKFNGGT